MAGSLPRLIDFYERAKSDRFEIIAFHEDAAQSFEELDEHLAAIKTKHWKGRDLPFPILLDASGETIRRFGIEAFPTMILIDPEGKLVGEADVRALEKALADQRAKK